MQSSVLAGLKGDDYLFLALTGLVAACFSFATFMACFWWYRREHRRFQKRILAAMNQGPSDPDELFLTGPDMAACGELIAQFKVNHGKRVVSLLESDGRRYIHVDGELSTVERAKMVRYLKSEGFMS